MTVTMLNDKQRRCLGDV